MPEVLLWQAVQVAEPKVAFSWQVWHLVGTLGAAIVSWHELHGRPAWDCLAGAMVPSWHVAHSLSGTALVVP